MKKRSMSNRGNENRIVQEFFYPIFLGDLCIFDGIDMKRVCVSIEI